MKKLCTSVILGILVIGCTPPKPRPVSRSNDDRCAIGDIITFAIQGTSPEGEGCGPNGEVGRSLERFEIFKDAQSQKALRKSGGDPFVEVLTNTLVPVSSESGCAVKGRFKIALTPHEKEEGGERISFTFTYDTKHVDRSITGTGNVVLEITNLEGTESIKPPCTEPFKVIDKAIFFEELPTSPSPAQDTASSSPPPSLSP